MSRVINSILGSWASLIAGLQSDSMMEVFEEMQKPVEERIAKRKKEIEENQQFFDSLDVFSKEKDKSGFDVEGIEEAIDEMLSQPNFDNVRIPETLNEKIELIKNRVHNIIELNKLLLMMEEKEIKE